VNRLVYQHCMEFATGILNIKEEHQQITEQRPSGYCRGMAWMRNMKTSKVLQSPRALMNSLS
jgi:hypothetical protein